MSLSLISNQKVQQHLDQKLFEIQTKGLTSAALKKVDLRKDAALAVDVVGALRAGRFGLVREPVWDIAENKTHFEEVLLRLTDSQGDAMPVFDSLMCLDRWELLAEIMPFLLTLQLEHGHTHPHHTSLNIPPSVLLPTGARQRLFQALENFAHTRPASEVVLEITETAYIEPDQQLADFMCQVRALGYRWALDDFGDGFHTFEHIQHLPLSYVKLAKDVSEQLQLSAQAAPEIAEMLELCKKLNLDLVAEHVSTKEAAENLHQWHGVRFAQMFEVPIAK